MSTEPLPGRTCGACSVCCKELAFEIDGRLVPAGVMCPHAAPPNGCTIHQTRPNVCRAYFCGWHHLPSLGEEWRPDKSQVLISFRQGTAPDGRKDGIDFELVGAHETLFWLPLVEYIATLIEDGDAVYLSLPGDPSPWVYLSDIAELKDAIARRDLAATTAVLREALRICADYPKTRPPDGIGSKE